MPLYPTLEDLKIGEILSDQEKQQVLDRAAEAQQSFSIDLKDAPISYSTISDYMGVKLRYYYDEKGDLVFAEQDMLCPQPLPNQPNSQAAAVSITEMSNNLINLPTKPAGAIQSGVRRIILCKDQKGKVGLQFKSIDNGIFVCFVAESSPAAIGGVKFGDQVLEINHNYMAGKSVSDVTAIIRHAAVNDVIMIVRDRPFERNISLYKDSHGQVGIIMRKGKINSIIKDSSAARNGVLTSHQIVEINGQNIIGLPDQKVADIINAVGECVNITVMPAPIFETMVKQLGKNQLKREMDHSIPDA